MALSLTRKALRLPSLLRAIQPFDFPGKLGICERLFGRFLSPAGIRWVQTSAGIRWKLDLGNQTLRWIVYGKYEGAPFLNWAKRFLPADGIVVDSGANIGQMLLYLAQWVPAGQVLAFEPGTHQADWLQECLDANPALPVELRRVGLGDTAKEAFLDECGPADRHGSWNQVSETQGEPITIVRLETVLNERKIENVDLWKLDVEGFEIPALRGAGELLTNGRIRAIYVELSGDNGRRIRDELEQHGYRGFLFKRNGKLEPLTVVPEHTNGLFLAAGTG